MKVCYILRFSFVNEVDLRDPCQSDRGHLEFKSHTSTTLPTVSLVIHSRQSPQKAVLVLRISASIAHMTCSEQARGPRTKDLNRVARKVTGEEQQEVEEGAGLGSSQECAPEGLHGPTSSKVLYSPIVS